MKKTLNNFLRPTHKKKFIFFVVGDAVIVSFSLYFSFLLRFDFSLRSPYADIVVNVLPLFLVVKIASFAFFHLYQLSWRFVSLRDFYNALRAVIVSSGVMMAAIYFLRIPAFEGFPRGIIIVDAIVTLLLISFLRVSKRVIIEVVMGQRRRGGKRMLIIGAGNTGEMILRDMQKSKFGNYTVVGFLDDDPNCVGAYVHGVKVLGDIDSLSAHVTAQQVVAVIIAIQTLGHARLRVIYGAAKNAGVKEVKIVPSLYDVQRPEIRAQELKDIKIEDLIGRQAVSIDYKEIGRAIEDKTVLVTGAGGSIGFELVDQICSFHPRKIVLFEIDETELYRAEVVLKRNHPECVGKIHLLVGDVRDRDRLEKVFAAHRPDMVFHAAAYKHVPMMEYNAGEAVKVNVLGTLNVARAALAWGADRFIMISTDKAVRPTSIMGATKRIAENICRALNTHGKTEYISVRFGNVLGSRGSVLPLFLEQIERGESLTVTHEDMLRYFMTIPEAVSLVLQASVIGRGGDVMVLDMGEPVRIVELAEELLRLHGLEPYKDLDIEFIGLRPGEKLFEEILTAEEGTIATRHEKIFVARMQGVDSIAVMEDMVRRFEQHVQLGDDDGKDIKRLLQEYVKWHDGGKESGYNNRDASPILIPSLVNKTDDSVR
ncbi:MAG: nucleoside-diphosphate sugar epimerase/dehydratase [bacterium]|nr:nucleoside-diphosphate sugar epimerase/dehydratase [bacterium]